MKVSTVLRDVSTKTPKIIWRKREEGHFRPNFGPILTILAKSWVTVIVKILKLKKVTLHCLSKSLIQIGIFYFIKKCYGIQKLLLTGRWSFPG